MPICHQSPCCLKFFYWWQYEENTISPPTVDLQKEKVLTAFSLFRRFAANGTTSKNFLLAANLRECYFTTNGASSIGLTPKSYTEKLARVEQAERPILVAFSPESLFAAKASPDHKTNIFPKKFGIY